MRRLVASLVAIGVMGLPLLTACGRGVSRERARQDLIDQLVDGGLERSLADCVVDGFFSERSDDELRSFFDRPELTDAERAEFARLGEACQSD